MYKPEDIIKLMNSGGPYQPQQRQQASQYKREDILKLIQEDANKNRAIGKEKAITIHKEIQTSDLLNKINTAIDQNLPTLANMNKRQQQIKKEAEETLLPSEKKLIVPRVIETIKKRWEPIAELGGKIGRGLGELTNIFWDKETRKTGGDIGYYAAKEGLMMPFVGLHGASSILESAIRDGLAKLNQANPLQKAKLIKPHEANHVFNLVTDNIYRKAREHGDKTLTKQQIKNWLIAGNLEGDLSKVNKKEMAKMWYAGLVDFGIDLYFAHQLVSDLISMKAEKMKEKGKLPEQPKEEVKLPDQSKEEVKLPEQPEKQKTEVLPEKETIKTSKKAKKETILPEKQQKIVETGSKIPEKEPIKKLKKITERIDIPEKVTPKEKIKEVKKAERALKKSLPEFKQPSEQLKSALKEVPKIKQIKTNIKIDPKEINKKSIENVIENIFKNIRKNKKLQPLLREKGYYLKTNPSSRAVAEYDFSSRRIRFDSTKLKHYLLANYYGRPSGGIRPTKIVRGVPTFGINPKPLAKETFPQYVARQIKELTRHELAHGITTIEDVGMLKDMRKQGVSPIKIQQHLHQTQRERLNKLFGKRFLVEPKETKIKVEPPKKRGRPKEEFSRRAVMEAKKQREKEQMIKMQKEKETITKEQIQLRSAKKLPSPAVLRVKATSQPNKTELLKTFRTAEQLFKKEDRTSIVKEYHRLLEQEIKEGKMAENPNGIYPSDIIRSYWEKHYPDITLDNGVKVEFNPDMLAEEVENSNNAYLINVYKEINRWAGRNEEAQILADLSKKELEKDAVRKGLAKKKGWRRIPEFIKTDVIVKKVGDEFKVKKVKPGEGMDVKELIDRYIAKPDKYEQYLTPEMKEHAQVIKEFFDNLWKIANQQKIIKEYRENYSMGIYQDDPQKIKTAMHSGKRLKGRPFFGMKKQFESPEDAELIGLHPIYDPHLKAEIYVKTLRRTINNKRLMEMLTSMVDENGRRLLLPLKEGKKYGYEPLGDVPDFNVKRFLGQKERTTKEGNLIRTLILSDQPLSASPEVKKILEDVFKPYPNNLYYRAWKKFTYLVLRMLLYNPLFHGTNVYSMGFITSGILDRAYKPKPFGMAKIMVSGLKSGGLTENTYLGQILEKEFGWTKGTDEALLYMAKAGVKVSEAKKAGEIMEKRFGGLFIDIPSDSTLNKIPGIRNVPNVVNTTAGFNDYLLWEVMVRNLQTYIFFGMRKKLLAEGKYGIEKIDEMAANFANTIVGTLPAHWFSRFENIILDGMFLAKNWTISNIQLVTGALGKLQELKWQNFKLPKIGRGNGKTIEITYEGKPLDLGKSNKHFLPNALRFKGYDTEQLKELGKWYRKFLVGGLVYKIIFDNLAQYVLAKIHNEKYHPTWQNEKGHRLDIDMYSYDKKGRRRYLHSPFGKAIVDVIHWGMAPGKTLHSKFEPVLRTQIELILENYDRFTGEKILKPGMTTPQKAKEILKYEFESLTPYGSIKPADYTLDPLEASIRLSGTWVRHGLAANLSERYSGIKKSDRREFFASIGVEESKKLLNLLEKLNSNKPLTNDEKLEASKLALKIIEFQQKKQYLTEKDDEDIDRSIMAGDYYNALNKIINTGRYTSVKEILRRFKRALGQL